MSRDQVVATFRAYLNAFNRRDIDAMIAQTAPGIEFHAPRGTTIRGHDALRAAMEEPGNLQLTVEPQRWFANVRNRRCRRARGSARRRGVPTSATRPWAC